MFEDLLPVVIINVPYFSRKQPIMGHQKWSWLEDNDEYCMTTGIIIGQLIGILHWWFFWEFSSVTIGHKKFIIDDLEYSPIFIGQSIAVDSCHSADRCLLGLLDMLDFIRMLAPALWQVGSRGVVAIPLRSLNMKHSPRIPHIRKSPTRLVNPGFGGCV